MSNKKYNKLKKLQLKALKIFRKFKIKVNNQIKIKIFQWEVKVVIIVEEFKNKLLKIWVRKVYFWVMLELII
jgi:hypothetical protein